MEMCIHKPRDMPALFHLLKEKKTTNQPTQKPKAIKKT